VGRIELTFDRGPRAPVFAREARVPPFRSRRLLNSGDVEAQDRIDARRGVAPATEAFARRGLSLGAPLSSRAERHVVACRPKSRLRRDPL